MFISEISFLRIFLQLRKGRIIIMLIIITVTLGYAIMKIPDLVLKTNPIINENNIQNYYVK